MKLAEKELIWEDINTKVGVLKIKLNENYDVNLEECIEEYETLIEDYKMHGTSAMELCALHEDITVTLGSIR